MLNVKQRDARKGTFLRDYFNDTQRNLTNIDPEQIIEYTTARGDVFRHRVRDLLFQALNHTTYHRGQLASEFRQMGLEPLVTDYVFYKMQGH